MIWFDLKQTCCFSVYAVAGCRPLTVHVTGLWDKLICTVSPLKFVLGDSLLVFLSECDSGLCSFSECWQRRGCKRSSIYQDQYINTGKTFTYKSLLSCGDSGLLSTKIMFTFPCSFGCSDLNFWFVSVVEISHRDTHPREKVSMGAAFETNWHKGAHNH